jgi:Fe(3+) dicitrate transport protein
MFLKAPNTRQIYILILLTIIVFFPFPNANADQGDVHTQDRSEKKSSILKRITVADTKETAHRLPGSVTVIDKQDLEDQTYGVDDIHRVLRQVPGVNIQEEEGYGLRPNIGFRGVPNERSSKITVMEDGVLIAPAPYSAPAAYYFPPIGRMEGVEVTKGAGQIKYGPYTTGGALNLLSTSIPDEFSSKVKTGVGNDNLLKLYANVGESWKYGGVMLETYQLRSDGFKKIDGGGDSGVTLEDYQLKLRINTDRDVNFYHELEYKIGFYDQISNETYLGLTQEDFGASPFRRYAASRRDRLDVDHIQHHIRHYGEIADNIDVTTTIYYNETQRNWVKLDSVGGTSISAILDNPRNFAEQFDWIRGNTSPDNALRIRHNQRDYESIGVQTVLGGDFNLGETTHSVEFGIRYHTDEEDRFQHDDDYRMDKGELILTRQGTAGSQANRIGSADAWAFFLQDKIEFDRFTFIPGLRYERINYTRKDYGKNDEFRTGESLVRHDSNVDTLIPGASLQYNITDEFALFAGVHKGFSPPGPVANAGTREEKSINYEWGASYSRSSLDTKLVLFYNDYDNLLGADTLSSGGAGTGDLFNAGQVDVFGAEVAFAYDLGEALDTFYMLPIQLSYTYTDSEFKNTFGSEFFGEVTKGDRVPYIAVHQLYVSLGFDNDPISLSLDGYFSDSMKTAAGEVGFADTTDSFMVFDVVAKWRHSDNLQFFATAENIFDREYVVARRPAGARPGLPLTVLAGLEVTF